MVKDSNMPDDPQKPAGSSLTGMKFNSTGRDDTSTDILVPKEDAGVRSRRIGLIAVILLAVVVGVYVSYLRNPISWDELMGKQEGPRFAVPDRRPE